MVPFRFSFIFLSLLFGACVDHTEVPKIQYIKSEGNAWHIQPIVDKDGERQIVFANYDGKVGLKKMADQENLWLYDGKAFVFDLKVRDIDMDGSVEIAFVTADGSLTVLDSSGNELWSFKSGLPLFTLDIGNVTGDGHLEIACGGIDRYVYLLDYQGNLVGKSDLAERLVHRLSVGDLHGDSYEEVLLIENRTIAHLMELRECALSTIWRKPLKVPDEYINWENPGGRFYAFSLEIDDLDQDGVNEILLGDTFFNKQAVMVADAQCNPLWISEKVPSFEYINGSQTEFYSTAFVRSSDIFPDYPGKEVISVAGGLLRIWTGEGQLLGTVNAKVGFTDMELEGNVLYLGSSPNGDDYFYKVLLDENWQNTMGNITYQGKIKGIKSNIAKLSDQVAQYPTTAEDSQTYQLTIGFRYGNNEEKRLAEFNRLKQWFKKQFPYKNLQIVASQKVIESTPPLDENGVPWSERRWATDAINGTYTVEEIVQKARWAEENQVPTLFNIGHSCMPFVTLETAEKILQAAPNYCVGFITSEDENLERIPRYFKHYFGPLADLCVKYGYRKCITKNKGLWWMSSPAIKEVHDALFLGERKKVAMSATEDSNSRTPEINLMGRGGLWQAGMLSHNNVSIHGDLFSFNRFHQWEYPKTGHAYLRLLIAHTTMGMTQVSARTRDIVPQGDSFGFITIGEESTAIFYHMLGKGLVFSPKPEDILGYSPIGIVVHRPPDKWLEDAHNGHRPEIWKDDPVLDKAIIPHNGNLWGMTNTPNHALQKVLFNKERQFGHQVPATPYGLVAFVPEYANLDKVSGISDWWHTDGVSIWRDGQKKYSGEEAAEVLLQEFKKAAYQMPFRQSGSAFMQVIRIDGNTFRLYLIDPGWIDPDERAVEVNIQLEGEFEAVNILTKAKYPIEGRRFQAIVPDGLFSIIEVKRKNG